MQRQLESLAAAAQVLTTSDQSLAAVVERIDRVRETGADRSANEGALQDEVEALLNQLNQQLNGNAVERSEVESLDRAYFVEF
jgi:molecular chaperone GrpE (heat shock protein)